jgi:hypothetical protein
MSKLARRAWQSPTLMTWLSLGIRLSGAVIVLPLVLHRFPVAEVAVWQLFASIFTLILILDLGVSPTFSRLFSFALGGATIEQMADMGPRRAVAATAGGDDAEARERAMRTAARLFGALRWIYPRLAGVAVLVFAIAGTWALHRPIAQCAAHTHLWLAWALVLAGGFVAIQGNAFGATLQGLNQVASQRRLEVITGAAQSVTSVVVLLLGGDILALVLGYQSWAVATACANRWLLLRRFPQLVQAPAHRDPEVLKVLLPAAWRSGIGVVMSHGLVQASGLVYGQLAPASALASYLLALRIGTVVSQLSQAPFYSQLPRLGMLQASGERDTQLALARLGMRRAQWVLCAGVVFVAFGIEPLLRWIGSRTAFVEPRLWALLALGLFAERYGAMHLQLYSLTNRIVWHIANGVSGLLMIGTAVGLYPFMGVLALPMGMLMAYAVFYSTYASLLSSRTFGFSLLRFEWRAGLPAGLVMVAALGLRLAMG